MSDPPKRLDESFRNASLIEFYSLFTSLRQRTKAREIVDRASHLIAVTNERAALKHHKTTPPPVMEHKPAGPTLGGGGQAAHYAINQRHEKRVKTITARMKGDLRRVATGKTLKQERAETRAAQQSRTLPPVQRTDKAWQKGRSLSAEFKRFR